MAFNKVILMGRLTADPELKQTQSGTAVTSFNLAVDRKYNKDEEKKCDFISVVAWRQTAEFICKYFKKGSAILLCGELQTRSWEDNNGNKRNVTEVVASEVSFCEAKSTAQGTNTSAPTNYVPDAYKEPQRGNFEAVEDIPEDGLPF